MGGDGRGCRLRRRGLTRIAGPLLAVLACAGPAVIVPSAEAAAAPKLLWADQNDGIGSANLDGTGVSKSFIGLSPSLVQPFGIAANSQHIYFTDLALGSVGEANLDG